MLKREGCWGKVLSVAISCLLFFSGTALAVEWTHEKDQLEQKIQALKIQVGSSDDHNEKVKISRQIVAVLKEYIRKEALAIEADPNLDRRSQRGEKFGQYVLSVMEFSEKVLSDALAAKRETCLEYANKYGTGPRYQSFCGN